MMPSTRQPPKPIIEVPSLYLMIRELRDAIPDEVHPMAKCFIHEWLDEANTRHGHQMRCG
jgi:hypothetical protein